ncbi:MAG TPA: RagB/SusD family nutrient uptake outer membrane protein, partial [Chitinophagaceae bacterium]|nr:RagB/SusD family nutrient uptake outer membrane protein [Chitinophagaceae bacterium]
MKRNYYILILASAFTISSCKKTIDLYPQSNLNTGTYYSNLEELKAGLTGCYNGMQNSLFNEWQFTELRSDNAKQGQPGSTASTNRDLSDLDMFIPSTSHQGIYTYWANTYNNIRNTNVVLLNLGVSYNSGTGEIDFGSVDLPVTDADRKQLAGEALFIRAYH